MKKKTPRARKPNNRPKARAVPAANINNRQAIFDLGQRLFQLENLFGQLLREIKAQMEPVGQALDLHSTVLELVAKSSVGAEMNEDELAALAEFVDSHDPGWPAGPAPKEEAPEPEAAAGDAS